MSPGEDRVTLLTEFSPDRRVLVEWTVLSTGMTFLAAIVFAAIFSIGTGRDGIDFQAGSRETLLVGFVILVLSIVGVIVVHEAIHALVLRYYGADVSFGVGMAGFVFPYAYVSTAHRLTRNQFIVVALAPLLVISLVGVPVMLGPDSQWLILPLALNAGGAIVDCWKVSILRRYPAHVIVEDSKSGLRIYGTPADVPRDPPGPRTLLRQFGLGSALGFSIIVLGGIGSTILLPLIGVDSLTLGVPDTPWYALAIESGPDGFDAGVNGGGMVIGSALLGCGYAIVTGTRRDPDSQ